MGLDIRVLKNCKFVAEQVEDEQFENGDLTGLFNKDFPDRSKGMQDGYYEAEYDHSFRAGSYSGYSTWRRALCEHFLGVQPQVVWNNPDDYKDKPFFELIMFSDCEGYLSTEVCKKLSNDFESNRDKLPTPIGTEVAEISYGTPDHLIARYNSFAKGLKIAAENNGVLDFC